MTYLISDIHGEYELFLRLLDKIGYSDSDELIVCGDIIEKGDSSVRLLRYIFDMPNAYCIKGNHEHMFFKFYRSRMHSAIMDFDAILWHLQQYFGEDGELLDWETVDRLVDLPYYIERDRFICVHAGIPLDADGYLTDVRDADVELLVNDRHFKEPSVLPKGEKCVFFGHTPTRYVNQDGGIITYSRDGAERDRPTLKDLCKVHLDTGVYLTGKLGAFRADDCRAFYVEK